MTYKTELKELCLVSIGRGGSKGAVQLQPPSSKRFFRLCLQCTWCSKGQSGRGLSWQAPVPPTSMGHMDWGSAV